MKLSLPKNYSKKEADEIQALYNIALLMGLCGVNLRFNVHDRERPLEGTIYNRLNFEITISGNLPDKYFKYSLIHELGHYLQDIQDRFYLAHNPNLASSENKILTTEEKEQIIAYEEDAWNKGEALALSYKITLDKDFYRFKQEALDSYRALPTIEHPRPANPIHLGLKWMTEPF